jgi:hypothetical protein
MVESADNKAELVFDQVRAFAKAITASARESNQKWPFVTVPYFDIRSGDTQALIDSELILFAPLVKQKKRVAWENYVVQKQDWIHQDLVRI